MLREERARYHRRAGYDTQSQYRMLIQQATQDTGQVTHNPVKQGTPTPTVHGRSTLDIGLLKIITIQYQQTKKKTHLTSNSFDSFK